MYHEWPQSAGLKYTMLIIFVMVFLCIGYTSVHRDWPESAQVECAMLMFITVFIHVLVIQIYLSVCVMNGRKALELNMRC